MQQDTFTRTDSDIKNYSGAPPYPYANIQIKGKPLDAQQILLNYRYGATITIPIPNGSTTQVNDRPLYTIPCFAKSDFSFSLGNTWTDLFPQVDSISALVSHLANMESLVEPAIPGLSVRNASQIAFKSREMKAQMWSGSQIPKFSVDCIFVCTTSEYNPINPILALSASCLPLRTAQVEVSNAYGGYKALSGKMAQAVYDNSKKFAQNVSNGTNDSKKQTVDANVDFYNGVSNMIANIGMAAPLGYGLKVSGDGQLQPIPNSTCCLQIGNWFYASDLIVQDMSNIVFSKEVVTDMDFPLYTMCTLVLSPYKPIFYDEFLNYFVLQGRPINQTPTVLREESGLAGEIA